MPWNSTSRIALLLPLAFCFMAAAPAEDRVRDLQTAAIRDGKLPQFHWGVEAENYTHWGSHSNRLIPIYTYGTRKAGRGVDLGDYLNERSPYRSEERTRKIYGFLPENTVSKQAAYMDQTQIYELQAAALAAGKKYLFLVIFDGMDWDTTRAAAIYNMGKVSYTAGRGRGTHFQNYDAAGTSQFGFMVTSPHNEGTKVDVNLQSVLNPGGKQLGGYDPHRGGWTPWAVGIDGNYLLARKGDLGEAHPYTDSSSAAVSMTAGIKTYNGAVNVDAAGAQVATIAHLAQEQGYAVGAISSVPISHATPAAAYAHNVDRDDFQDLTRDLLGLPSISHPSQPLAGMDVVIGTGWGVLAEKDDPQGTNFVPGNRYLTDSDLKAADARHGGRYVVAARTPGNPGNAVLEQAANKAVSERKRLLGFFGTPYGHLPFATANGDFQPVPGRKLKAETYSPGDLSENPTLAQMTAAAIQTLSQRERGFWLMVEAGDVDWANHDNNIDNSIGAVNSGDDAVKVITTWVEQHSNWNESLLIVTADHGHYLVLEDPSALIDASRTATKGSVEPK